MSRASWGCTLLPLGTTVSALCACVELELGDLGRVLMVKLGSYSEISAVTPISWPLLQDLGRDPVTVRTVWPLAINGV